jgi:hypothetical protein
LSQQELAHALPWLRASQLGLQPDSSFEDIMRQYIADCRAAPDGAAALKGLQA